VWAVWEWAKLVAKKRIASAKARNCCVRITARIIAIRQQVAGNVPETVKLNGLKRLNRR
jgi:hypothetical protein